MDVFLEPAVIVSLVCSLLIAMLSKRLTHVGEYLITHISPFPERIRTRIRVLRWQNRKKLILDALSYHKVTWSIIRTYTLLIFFALAIVLYLLLIAIGPLKGIGTLPWPIQAFIASPVYVLEVLWLLQKEKTTVLVRVAEQRVTNQSTSRLRRRTR